MNTLLGLILPLSIAGYSLLLKTKLQISFYYAPFFAINVISTLMYIAGLLNIMMPMAYCIGIVGVGVMITCAKKYINRNALLCSKNNILPIMLMLISLVYLAWYWKDGVYSGSDTLTHWGIIARSMYKRNALPNFTCTEISYTSYPPITSCWIYYFLIFVGYSEANCMMAQGVWMYTCVITLFSINHKRKIFNDLLICVSGIYLMVMIEGMDGLKVDTLLGLVTGAAIIYILQYSNSKSILSSSKILIMASLISITLIKNSGILFSIFVALCFIVCNKVNNKDSIITSFEIILLPIITLWLWQKHIAMVYIDAGTSRHSLSIGAMQEIFGSRTPEKIKSIIENYIQKWFSWNGSCEWQILIFFGISFIIFLIYKYITHKDFFTNSKELFRTIIIVIIFMILYKISLLGMYLFNFPGDEADAIYAYERYMGSFTIIIAFLGIYFVTNIGLVINKTIVYILYIILAICSAYIYLHTSDPRLIDRLSRPNYSQGTFYRNLTSILRHNEEDYHDKNMLLYISERFAGYGIRFATDNQKSYATYNIDEIYEALETNRYEYDGIVIMEHDELIDSLLESVEKDKSTEYISLQNH